MTADREFCDVWDWDAECVLVDRTMLMAGILVGISEWDSVPSTEQVERAADMIMRSGRRRREAAERLLAAAADAARDAR